MTTHVTTELPRSHSDRGMRNLHTRSQRSCADQGKRPAGTDAAARRGYSRLLKQRLLVAEDCSCAGLEGAV